MADNKLNYQQAKRVRGTSFKDLFVDQLASKGVVGSIGKTISMKTQAKIKGIKEKFDPLAIAKFMTFGSKLGPALLGKMMGRKQEDIDYFTGRLRHIRFGGKSEKLNKMGGEGEGGSGINEQLAKIYGFLKSSYENQKILKQKSENFAEELSMEKKRRHDELMTTLKELMKRINPNATAEPEESKSMFDNLFDMLSNFGVLLAQLGAKVAGLAVDLAKSIARTAAQVAAPAMKWALGAALSPLGLAAGVAAVIATPFALSAIEKRKIDENPYSKEYDNNAYALSVRSKREGGNLTEGQATEQLKAKSIKQMSRQNIVEAVDSKLTDDLLMQEYGTDRPGLKQWLKDNPKQNAMYQVPVQGLSVPQTATPMPAPAANPEATTTFGTPNDVRQGRGFNSPSSTPAPMATPVPPASPVSNLTNNNIDLNMQSAATDNSLNDVVNKTVTNVSQNQQRVGLRPSEISVRNDEETFMDLIMKSTRVV
jgi:hypothetical protein